MTPQHEEGVYRRTAASLLAALLTLAACGGDGSSVPARSKRALAHEPLPPTVSELIDWAEKTYPDLFPGHQSNLSFDQYTYRYYPLSGNYVGVGNTSIYLMGPLAATLGGERYRTEPFYYGEVKSFTCVIFPERCGRKTVHRATVAGQEREYIVYQPWSAQQPGIAPVPVVFMLHGTTGDGEKFFNISGWREKADTEGFVAVFPSALVHCFREDENRDGVIGNDERQVTTKWSAGSLGQADQRPLCSAADIAALPPDKRSLADHPLADDMAFFRHMLDALPRDYPVDMKRVYASGFSNGGEMTSRLAVQMSERFAAIAAAAGNLNVDVVPAARRLSVTVSVGSIDPGFATSLGHPTGIPLTASLGGESAFQSRLSTPWTQVLQLGTGYQWSNPRIDGTATSRFVYSQSTGGAQNRLNVLIIDGADHQYPNGKNHPVVMANLLWTFFAPERLP